MSALVLLAHGSKESPDSSAPCRACARAIAKMGIFEQVVAGFWKESPPWHSVLDLVTAEPVYVVPFFMADGFYTRQVIPRELDLAHRPQVVMCAPVGTDPRLTRIVLDRAAAAPFESASSALVLVGHGTLKSSTSTQSVEAHAARVRAMGLFREVVSVFTDDAPRVDEALALTCADSVVVVPVMTSEGFHTRQTIPAALRAPTGRQVWITEAVGTAPALVEVILDRVRQRAERPLAEVDSVVSVLVAGA